MSRTPNAALGRFVLVTKCAVVGALAVVAATLAGTVETEGVTAGQEIVTASPDQGRSARLEALMTRHWCSSTGFGPEVVPASALVLRHGRLRHVTFDDGWDTYTGLSPGTLVAVCQASV